MPITVRGARSCQLLAYLALHRETVVSAERLSAALWGEDPPASSRNSIQRFVSDLRRDLGSARSRIVSAGSGYRLEFRDVDWCDAIALEEDLPLARAALADGRPGDARSLIGNLAKAFSEPLVSLDGAAFAASERERLSELMADCGEVDAEARLSQGDNAGSVTSARRLLEQHPYRERLCITLAIALTRLGRANEALEVISAFRQRIRHDLGLDPSPAIERTELDILLHRDAAPPDTVPDVGGAADSVMESGATVLFGRDVDVDQAVELLETKRVVTLTGTGGIGKTATALAVVERWRRRHGGAIRFVSLEEITAQGLAASVGQVVGTSAKVGTDPLGEVVDRIRAQVDLLILDNCEHIANEVGAFLDAVFEEASSVKVLATSRRPLHKVYEQLVPLQPLDRGASRGLLMRELGRVGVELTDLGDDAVVELLDELDGLPLAIELAGASLRSGGVRDLLTRWRDDAPRPNGKRDRHLSIASAIRSTLAQLDGGERELLGLCALFPADFDAAAIEVLAGRAVLGPLQSLSDHSLLEVSEGFDMPRFRMLVPVRSEIRAQSDPVEQRQREAFVAHFDQQSGDCLEKMKGLDSADGVAELRRELSNISMAFNFADDEGDIAAMASMVGSVGLANGMSPSVGAKSHLQEWVERLRVRSSKLDLDPTLSTSVESALAWGLYGSSDGAWYQRWEFGSQTSNIETLAMAAIARFSCGESAEAWNLLLDLDLTAVPDPYMRAMLCGVGAVIAFEVGATEGEVLAAAAVGAAAAVPSHGASFFAGLARSTQAFVAGDVASSVAILEAAAESIDGHGLVTLENMGLAAVAMTVGFILGEREPTHLLIGILDRYLEQHSLDPASVAMALDVAVLHLDRAGRTAEAATLLGLLDRLGLSMAIVRGARVGVEQRIEEHPDWRRARRAGATKTTFDVLRSVRTALVDIAEAR